MTPEEYIDLYKKFLSGTATPHEVELLTHYKDEFDIAGFVDDEPVPDEQLIRQRIFQQIRHRTSGKRQVRSMRRLWWSAAACFLLLMGAGAYLLNNKEQVQRLPQLVKMQKPIIPGTNKAILILGNGDKVDLDQTHNGQIARAGKVSINKLKNGQLAYENAAQTDAGKNEITFNTIITPRGGQYQVTLPDGTTVWLNSASSLRYPTAFTGHERHVELTGEAYFEVAKNKEMPFTVNAGKVDVKVLGTHFNISAYDDEPFSKTTLLEGSVKLSKNDQQVMLVPGQQAVAGDQSKKIITKTVNVQDAIAWKNGYFSFRKETLENAMRKIARWYDVEVVYQGKVSNKLLGGSVLRTENITEVLKVLELAEIAKFKIEGRRIMVKTN